MRKLSALLAAAVMLPALAACSGPAGGCDVPFSSGDASSVVTATGKIGSTPTIDMPTPVIAEQTEVSTLIEGDGPVVTDGQAVRLEVSIVNGASGEVLQASDYAGQASGIVVTAGSDTLPPVTEALLCTTVGSRIVVAGTAAETHDGQASPELGISENDSFVYVVDVLDAFLAKADGRTRAGDNGDPTVVLAPNGRPGVTIPQTDAPEELRSSVLKQGSGDTLEDGDFAIVHFSGFTWADNEMFDSSWERNQAAVWKLSEGATMEGLRESLIGREVGSQVLVIVPPAAGPEDPASAGVPAGSTLVYVVDILGIVE